MLHNFLELPGPCWFVIFKRLPTVDVLKINAVCHRLKELQTSYLKSKTSLRIVYLKFSKCPLHWNNWTLYDALGPPDFTAKYQERPDNDNYYYDEEDVSNGLTEFLPDPFEVHPDLVPFRRQFDLKLTAENVAVLARKLPNIKRLTIGDHRYRSCLQYEENILEYWPELTHLCLIPYTWKNLDTELFESINQLRSLKHLAVSADIGILKHLTIRGQLQEFCATYCYAHFEQKEKTKQEDKQSLARINELFSNTEKKFGLFIERTILNNSVFSLPCFQQLSKLAFEPSSLEELDKICTSLSQLTFLEFRINAEPGILGLAIIDFLYPVGQLKHLSQLTIKTSESKKYFFVKPNQPIRNLVLESVKEVRFHLRIKAHSTVRLIKAIFPNAHKITLQLVPQQQIGMLENLCKDVQCGICLQFRDFYSVMPGLFACIVMFDLAPAQIAIDNVDLPVYK